jgi:K+-transporting ATPase A subunit
MKARMTLLASFALTAGLLYAVPALAHDNGEGLVGETDDKIITFFSLGVVVFFAVLVSVLSWLQSTLEKRKQQRKATAVRDIVGW